MVTATRTRKPAEKTRTANISHGPTFSTLTINDGKGQWLYRLEEIKADFGRGFRLVRRDFNPATFDLVDGEEYHVNIGGGHGNSDMCDCKGNCRWNHCKHASAIRALIKAGKI